jgi:hypothetical protein
MSAGQRRRLHERAGTVAGLLACIVTLHGCETSTTLQDPAGEFEVTVRDGELAERRDDDALFRVDADVMSVQRYTLSRFDADRTLEDLAEVLTRRHAAELEGAPLVWTRCEWGGRAARCARGHVEVAGVRHERRGVLWRTGDVVAWLDVSTRASGAAIDERMQAVADGWRWIERNGEDS